jgi:hypothetical protein
MSPDLRSMHATAIFDPRDVKRSAVRLLPTIHGRRPQSLEIQLVAVRYPSYRPGITDKNFELVELKISGELRAKSGKCGNFVNLPQQPCHHTQWLNLP